MEQQNSGYPDSGRAELTQLVNTLLDGFDELPADLPGVAAQLSATRLSAWSPDGLVEVTVDAYGVVLDVQLSSRAFEAHSPEQLARSVTEAARSAALIAQRRRAEIVAPITATVGDLPDLPDLFQGAPSLRGIREMVESSQAGDDEPTQG